MEKEDVKTAKSADTKKKKLSLKAALIVTMAALTLTSMTACTKGQAQNQPTQEQPTQEQPAQKEDVDAFLAQRYEDDPNLSKVQNDFYDASLTFVQSVVAVWEGKDFPYDMTKSEIALGYAFREVGYSDEEIEKMRKEAMNLQGTYQEKVDFLWSLYPKKEVGHAANDNSYTVVKNAEIPSVGEERQRVNE